MDNTRDTGSLINSLIEATNDAILALKQFENYSELENMSVTVSEDTLSTIRTFLNYARLSLNQSNHDLLCTQNAKAALKHINNIRDILRSTDADSNASEKIVKEIDDTLPYLATLVRKNEIDTSAYHAKLQEHLERLNGEAENIQRTTQATLDEALQTITTKLDVALQRIEDKNNQASDMVSIIANKALTSDYLTVSESEKEEAKQWSQYTLISAGSWVACNLLSLYIGAKCNFIDQLDSISIISRNFVYNAPFLIFTAFSAYQVSVHQKMEQICRKTALDLKTIEPYLQNMPEANQIEIKSALAHRLFGPIKSENEKIPSSILELLHKAIASKGQGKPE